MLSIRSFSFWEGNEVIPMPCIRNEPALFESDENIYSDLPFSYMMNHTFADELWAGNLMAHELRFQVGRFPTGGGVCFDDLANYLANTISALTDSRLVLTIVLESVQVHGKLLQKRS